MQPAKRMKMAVETDQKQGSIPWMDTQVCEDLDNDATTLPPLSTSVTLQQKPCFLTVMNLLFFHWNILSWPMPVTTMMSP